MDSTVILNNSVSMPRIGLGTYALRGKECETAICEAVECGYRLFDSAQMYGNERSVGAGIRVSGIPRYEAFVTTKLNGDCAGYLRAREGIERSLEALNLEYIDLLLIHEPYPESREMYRAMEEAYKAGLVRAIGVSNFSIEQFDRLVRESDITPAVNQIELHPYFQQRGITAAMQMRGCQVQAWSPFSAGKSGIFTDPVLMEIAADHCKSVAQVCLNYIASCGVCSVPKTSSHKRMAENFASFDFELTPAEIERIRALDTRRSQFGWY